MKKVFTIIALAGTVSALAQTTVKWNGAVSADWDNASANWLPLEGLPFPTTIAAGDHAIITNERTDGADTLKVVAELTVGNVSVNNNADYTYTITNNGVATNKLAGTGTFTKEGVGELRMGVLNEMTGGTVMKEGVMKQVQATVNAFGPKVSLEGGQMWFAQGSASAYTTTNARIAVPEGKTGELYSGRYHYLDSAITGSGTLNMIANGERVLWRFTKGAKGRDFNGQINVYRVGNPYNAGSKGVGIGLGLVTDSTWVSDAGTGANTELKNAKVQLGLGASLYSESGTRCYEIGELTAANDTSYLLGYYKASNSPMIYWKIGGLNTDVVFPGTIRPAAVDATTNLPRTDNKVGIVKVGTGTYRFTSGKNFITLGIEIKEGAVMINNPADSESGTGYQTTKGTVIFVRPNTTLGGTGRISGNIDVEGRLVIGDNSMDSLTVGDLKSAYNSLSTRRMFTAILRSTATVEMEIASTSSHDMLVADSVSAGGSLVVNLAASYSINPGDSILLFKNYKGISGEFASIQLPKTGEGWTWDTSNLYKYGTIKLTAGGGTVGTKVKSVIDAQVTVAPNPSNGIFKVNVPAGKGVSVHVFDVTGSLVASQSIVGASADVDLTSGKKGIYLVKIVTVEGTVVRKAVVR